MNTLFKKQCTYHDPKPYNGIGGHTPLDPDKCNCDRPLSQPSKGSGSGVSQNLD